MKKLKTNYFLKEFKNNKEIIITKKEVYIKPWALTNHRPLPELIIDALNSQLTNFNIIINNPEEYEIGSNFEILFDQKIREQLKSQNVKIYFIFGSQSLDFYKQDNFLYHAPEYNMIVNLWPTFWFNLTKMSIDTKYLNDKAFVYKEDIVYPFTSLNHIGKYHRCLLMDLLAKNNLLDKGAVTWHNFYIDTGYFWNYTTPQKAKRHLSDGKKYTKDTYVQQFYPPKEFFQSFMSIVSETTDKTIFITEKTSTVLLFKQPFLVQGAMGFHNYLKDLGFKLYTEIFDYSFDLEPDLHKRTEMIIENVRSIMNSNLNQLYKSIKLKLDYNQQRYFEIINNKVGYPQIVITNPILKKFYSNYNFVSEYDL